MRANTKQVGGTHYMKGGEYQHWDYITNYYGPGYLIGCATKYLLRWRNKNGIEDLKKAAHYCEKLVEVTQHYQPEPHDAVGLKHFLIVNDVGKEDAKIIEKIVSWQKPDDFNIAIYMIRMMIKNADPAFYPTL